MESVSSLKDGVSGDDATPAQDLLSRERADAVRKAVAELPEDLRQALILSVYEDLPHAEIASVLNCSPKAVEMRLYRARQQLKASLSQLVTP